MTQTATAPTSPESRPERPRSHWDRVATAAEHEHWDAVAACVAETLAADVLERDRGNLDPTTELEPLRSSGLVNLLDPAEFGGGGAVWSTAFRVIRILAAADASLDRASAQVEKLPGKVSGQLGSVVATVFAGLFGTLTVLFLMVLLLIGGNDIVRGIVQVFPAIASRR